MEYRLGAWLPDQQDFKNPGLEDCRNAIPGPNGYRPARSPVSTGASIPGEIIGGASTYLVNGEVIIFVATTADLYVIRSGAVTASGLGLALSSLDIVAFEQFGSAVYATTKNGATWALSDIELVNTFVASGGSPPSANAIGRINDFLVMGDLIDVDASNAPYRVRWSAFNNPEGPWVTDIAVQSDAVEFDAKFGPITAISSVADGLVFQRNGISRFNFTGSETVFRRDQFEYERGCIAPASLVEVGETAYYLAHDGFSATDGTTPRTISTGKVWEWFLERCNQVYIQYVAGALDYEKRCVVWLFPSGSTQGYTQQLWYHWETDQWGYVEQPIDWALSSVKSGTTLEQLALIYPNLDTMPVSLDSPEFQASSRTLQVLNQGDLSNLSGGTLEARFQGGDLQPFEGRRSFVESVTPLVSADQVSVTLSGRDRMTRARTDSGTVPMGPIGFAPFNYDARYFSIIMDIPAGEEWFDAYGYQLDATESGAT